ncbi:hypothetical protein FHU36_003767 [Nonomuraea muscovyensis]|uniref:Uncharacterized protein n=1 Tax=Nonomuraea muscovyensis TaxID=1124761 RepID=A0A7X0EWP9_9ACTN|nr:hypothetical protein [Nonomuraea muscovyensis]MBB6347222.1 hypothetical protein [Nonomuraea muscovyensis]
MARRRMLCERYERGASARRNELEAGDYLATAACEDLPRELFRDDHIVRRGYGVEFGQWFFFGALEPAIAFGRAARMSLDCHAYGVYRAAHETLFCQIHRRDERVLLLTGDSLDRRDGEVEVLKRFVQGVKEHPWSSHWQGVTGFITDYNNARPIKTGRRSLPL